MRARCPHGIMVDEPCEECQDEADEQEFEFDCHMDKDGYCGMAGSEDCEFECPYRNWKR